MVADSLPTDAPSTSGFVSVVVGGDAALEDTLDVVLEDAGAGDGGGLPHPADNTPNPKVATQAHERRMALTPMIC